MSSKSSGLVYDKNEPAFLRRLKSQHAGGTGYRHNLENRPKALGRGVDYDDDDDDAPQYVVEESDQVLTKEQFDRLVKGQGIEGGDDVKSITEHQDVAEHNGRGEKESRKELVATRQKQNLTEAGGGGIKKRKQGKIIGDNDDERERDNEARTEGKKSHKTTSEHSQSTVNTPGPNTNDTKKGRKSKTKPKRIKLSFEEDEEE